MGGRKGWGRGREGEGWREEEVGVGRGTEGRIGGRDRREGGMERLGGREEEGEVGEREWRDGGKRVHGRCQLL